MDNIRNELEKLRNEVWHILQMDYSKRGDFIPSILGRIDGILEAPKRNCDVGTAKEQMERFRAFCVTMHDNIHHCKQCPLDGASATCEFEWSLLPYEKGENDE